VSVGDEYESEQATEKAQEAVMTAQNLASEFNHSEIVPEHLLVALVEQSGGIVPSICAS
jgi:ATP-dependent Clp protease ATP-binding subunit ClpB